MLKDFGQVTPHQILDKLGFVVQKPKPDQELIASTLDNLPVANRKNLALHGHGDWSHGRSSGGSVVLTDTNYVLKIALGEQVNDQSPLDKAREIAVTAKKFTDVSPSTGFFIAQVDGPDKPAKVVIFQAKNHGKPACDTPINRLLSPEISRQFVTIIDRMLEVLHQDNLLDGIGIHLDGSSPLKRFFIRAICGLPWVSDNIMVDENNHVELVDNVPALESHQITNPVKKAIFQTVPFWNWSFRDTIHQNLCSEPNFLTPPQRRFKSTG